MKRYAYTLIPLIFLLFGTGCATTKKYEKILNSWTGSDRDDLVSSWGRPAHSFKGANGNTIYAYEDTEAIYTPAFTMPAQSETVLRGGMAQFAATGSQTYGGGVQVTYECKTFFEFDSSNKIVSWRWEGNNCIAQ